MLNSAQENLALTALKAQHEPQYPWFLTSVTQPSSLQSTVYGRAAPPFCRKNVAAWCLAVLLKDLRTLINIDSLYSWLLCSRWKFRQICNLFSAFIFPQTVAVNRLLCGPYCFYSVNTLPLSVYITTFMNICIYCPCY